MKFQALVFALALAGASFAQAEDHGHEHEMDQAHEMMAPTEEAEAAEMAPEATQKPAKVAIKKGKKASGKKCSKMKNEAARAKCMEETAKM